MAATPSRRRLPLTVIGGFLGAGKTTLLNGILRASRGRRLAVLVNDFGALNIDAELVQSTSGDTIALTNGCVCCSIGDDLTAALITVLESPVPFDAVVIEASGVSDPWRIAQVALADPALGLDGVIVVVDASACLMHAADPLLADSLLRQLQAADLIVVNQCDRVDIDALQQVRDWLMRVAAGTPVFETTQAEVPLRLLSSSALSLDNRPSGTLCPGTGRESTLSATHAGVTGREHRHPHEHGELFDTWSFRPGHEFSAQALRALLRAMPSGVLRMKGLLRTDEHGWSELQFAGRHGSLRKALAAPISGATVVAIGLHDRLPVEALRAALAADASGTV